MASPAAIVPEKKPAVHPIQSYLREFVKQLPLIDNTGFAYKFEEGTRGHASKETRKYYKSRTALLEKLPSNPHFTSHPRERAQQHKATDFWTNANMKKARDEFYVPPGMQVQVICPEIYDRDLLKYSDKHKKARTGGLMSPCPKCNTNYYMRITGWTTTRPFCQKVINAKLTQDIVIGAIYGCYNSTTGCCTRKKIKPNSDATREVPSYFTSYEKTFWKQFPDSIRRRYLDYISNIDDKTTQLMLSPGFADWLLFHKGLF